MCRLSLWSIVFLLVLYSSSITTTTTTDSLGLWRDTLLVMWNDCFVCVCVFESIYLCVYLYVFIELGYEGRFRRVCVWSTKDGWLVPGWMVVVSSANGRLRKTTHTRRRLLDFGCALIQTTHTPTTPISLSLSLVQLTHSDDRLYSCRCSWYCGGSCR